MQLLPADICRKVYQTAPETPARFWYMLCFYRFLIEDKDSSCYTESTVDPRADADM